MSWEIHFLGLDRIIIATFRSVAVVTDVTTAAPVGNLIVNFTAAAADLIFWIVDYVSTLLEKKIQS